MKKLIVYVLALWFVCVSGQELEIVTILETSKPGLLRHRIYSCKDAIFLKDMLLVALERPLADRSEKVRIIAQKLCAAILDNTNVATQPQAFLRLLASIEGKKESFSDVLTKAALSEVQSNLQAIPEITICQCTDVMCLKDLLSADLQNPPSDQFERTKLIAQRLYVAIVENRRAVTEDAQAFENLFASIESKKESFADSLTKSTLGEVQSVLKTIPEIMIDDTIVQKIDGLRKAYLEALYRAEHPAEREKHRDLENAAECARRTLENIQNKWNRRRALAKAESDEEMCRLLLPIDMPVDQGVIRQSYEKALSQFALQDESALEQLRVSEFQRLAGPPVARPQAVPVLRRSEFSRLDRGPSNLPQNSSQLPEPPRAISVDDTNGSRHGDRQADQRRSRQNNNSDTTKTATKRQAGFLQRHATVLLGCCALGAFFGHQLYDYCRIKQEKPKDQPSKEKSQEPAEEQLIADQASA